MGPLTGSASRGGSAGPAAVPAGDVPTVTPRAGGGKAGAPNLAVTPEAVGRPMDMSILTVSSLVLSSASLSGPAPPPPVAVHAAAPPTVQVRRSAYGPVLF